MQNTISKYMMIAAAAAVLFGAAEAMAQKGGTGTTAPTPVEEQAVPAKTGVVITYNCAPNTSTCITGYGVPATMRLVVEGIHAELFAASPVPLVLRFPAALDGVNQGSIPVFPSQFFSTGMVNDFVNGYDEQVKIYTDALGTITLSAGLKMGTLRLTGYLVKK